MAAGATLFAISRSFILSLLQVIDKQDLKGSLLPPALRYLAADFFQPLPSALLDDGGLDAALFKFILHDWDDKV